LGGVFFALFDLVEVFAGRFGNEFLFKGVWFENIFQKGAPIKKATTGAINIHNV
jgi:hypothetical protein